MDTDVHSNTPPSVWLDMSNVIPQAESENSVPRQDSSQLTTRSSETDFTQANTTASSIRTAPTRKSISELSLQNRRDSDLRQQYEQKPEKVPDVAVEMEKWYAMTDRYGFLEEQPSKSELTLKAKEVERAKKWADMSTTVKIDQENAYKFIFNLKFRKRVYKGIPDCWRREAWYYLATEQLENATKDHKLRATYQELLLKENTHERQIDLDIPRTLRDHIMFRQRYGSGQRALFNVLRAFANYDEEVGYCQGMTNIVATILMYCEEERTFLVLVHMFLRDKLHNLYIPGFPMLMESFYIQEALLRRYLPKLYIHLVSMSLSTLKTYRGIHYIKTDLGLSSDIYSTRWYITLFAGGVVQYHTLMRIWDVYFLCGYDIFFFVAVALLKSHEALLLSSDLDVCMEILGSTLSVPNDDKFLRTIEKLFERNEKNGTIQKLRQEYQAKH
ncbi:hypothetical protein [Parasitella parasitica]|uniref:Rab-GAP TBC domain-containing protein n=1 Tax=Parasitella parasitica TaxID=35722 RepID=A0A0B7N3H4_9FUNG|nr:hypothetical protein [Parasitella parasitica]